MKVNIEEIATYLENVSDESKIYIGCDSVRYQKKDKWYARYTLVMVIHIDGCRGCKIFGGNVHERDYENNHKKPSMRLMNEVYKVMEFYEQIAPIIDQREIEIHLDINPNEKHASSIVLNQAIGYVKGMTGINPKVKPEAFAASRAADQFSVKVGDVSYDEVV